MNKKKDKKRDKPKRKPPPPPHKRRSKPTYSYCDGKGCEACRGKGGKVI